MVSHSKTSFPRHQAWCGGQWLMASCGCARPPRTTILCILLVAGVCDRACVARARACVQLPLHCTHCLSRRPLHGGEPADGAALVLLRCSMRLAVCRPGCHSTGGAQDTPGARRARDEATVGAVRVCRPGATRPRPARLRAPRALGGEAVGSGRGTEVCKGYFGQSQPRRRAHPPGAASGCSGPREKWSSRLPCSWVRGTPCLSF